MLPFQNTCLVKFLSRRFLAVGLLGMTLTGVAAEYQDNQALAKQLKDLARAHRRIVRVESAAETSGKNDVWRVELGAGSDEERKRRPALLVVAGIEANDLAGTASALSWAQSLAKGYESDAKGKALLDSTTIYLWPRLNPDGARHFFSKPRRETFTGDQPADDDHDGLVDEDGPEDLNRDGLITWMRVEDPEGEYIPDPTEPRLLLKADRLKGERGAWRYLTEGRDDDRDKAWNEDGPGGVNLNRNFPFNFQFFSRGAGRHQVSEVETRALADFVVDHPNIGLAFTFGVTDNLAQTPKGEAPKRPPTAVHPEDVGWYREFGKSWREALGLKKELNSGAEPGTFPDWIYYHRGRLSLAARPWSVALQLELAKNKSRNNGAKTQDEKPKKEKGTEDEAKDGVSKKEEAGDKPDQKTGEKAKEAETRNEEERAFLKWVDENAPELFVPWKAFDHPDFPGQKVELGGFVPFARSNPPEKLLSDFAARHGRFLTELAGKLPRIGIRKAEAKHLGESVYEITALIENTGYLPTALAQGGLTREVHPTRVILKVEEKAVLSGTRVTMLNALSFGDAKEVRWVVRPKGVRKLDLEVLSVLAGRAQTSIELKEESK